MKEIFSKEINGFNNKSGMYIDVMPDCTVNITTHVDCAGCDNLTDFDIDGLNDLISILTEAKNHLMEMSKQ